MQEKKSRAPIVQSDELLGEAADAAFRIDQFGRFP